MHPLGKRVEWELMHLGKLLVVAVIAMWVPLIAGHIVLGPTAGTMLLYGSIIGFLNTAIGGRKVGAAASAIFMLITPVAAVVGMNALAGTCLMALACMFVGTSAYWARYGGFGTILVGIAFIMASPAAVLDKLDVGPAGTRYLFGVLIGTAVCAFWPVVIVPFLQPTQGLPAALRNTKPDTMRYLVAITVLVSASMYYALEYARNTHGVWLPLTLIMVLKVGAQATKQRAFQRVWGTIAGAIFASVAASFIHEKWALIALILVALLGMSATVGREPYALFAFFLTTLVLLSVSFSEPAVEASYQRIFYTVLGSAIALAAYWVKLGVARIVNERTPEPTATPTPQPER